MSHNSKPGDLALIVGSSGRRPETIGRFIELIEPADCGVEPAWIWDDHGTYEMTATKHLVPLKGYFTPEQQKKQEQPA